MSNLELNRSEPGTCGVRVIARQRIIGAIESLQSARLTDKKVHTARKELKKARASLRLLRDSLSNSTYQRENAVLRDAARPLSEIRDGKAMLNALGALVDRYGAAVRALPVKDVKRSLRRERSDARGRILNGAKGLRPVRAALRKASQRAARWPTGRHGWKVTGGGFERTYREGRKALAAAEAKRSIERLHDWRKQAKYLWHQLQVLQPLWPGMIGELADQTHKLTNYLGDNHDLAVLREKVLECGTEPSDAAAQGALIALIDRRRAELRDKAFVLGRRIYEEKPRQFAARFAEYWREWKSRPAASVS